MSREKKYLEEDPSLPPQGMAEQPKYHKELEGISIGAMKSAFQQTDPDDLAQQVLNSSGELSAQEYQNLYDHFMEKKMEFIGADKKKKALLIKDINDKSQAVKQFKTFRQDLASGVFNGTLMNGWIDSEEGKNYLNMLGDQPQLFEKRCDGDPNCPDKNKLGVILMDIEATERGESRLSEIDEEIAELKKYGRASRPRGTSPQENSATIKQLEIEQSMIETLLNEGDGYMSRWVTPGNLNRKIKNKDVAASRVLKEMANNNLNRSTRANPEDNVGFNADAIRRQLKHNVIDKSINFESLIYDEMIPGRVLYDDMIQKAMGHSYDALGVELDGVNTKDGIDEQEAKIIIDEMIKNEDHKDILENEMLSYYTEYMRKQWQTGEQNRPKPLKRNTYNEADMMADVIEKTTPKQYTPGVIAASVNKSKKA